jgi:hypothetical protein
MEDWQLPSELQRLERDLANRSLSAASIGLRQRVLDDARSRLRAERSRDRWQSAATVAAAALLWLNLSMSATQATDFDLRPKWPAESTGAIAEQVRQLAPEISPEEAWRQAILLRARANVPFMPDWVGSRVKVN